MTSPNSDEIFRMMLGFIEYKLLMSVFALEANIEAMLAAFNADLGMAWILALVALRQERVFARTLVEPRRIELLTSCVQDRCSPS